MSDQSAVPAEIAIIETHNLSKVYQRGATPALDNLNLRISRGALFGFIGPNGAGKTTTLRMLAGLLAPTSGDIWIAGQAVSEEPRAVHRHIGYMPDFFGLYQEMTCEEYLDFFARCHDLPEAQRQGMIHDLLELVGLTHKRDEDVGHLSRGMQQRLCLAQALVHDPQILLLDEPASGLDPRARVEMRELLRELSAMGKTIVLSSHILSELGEMCNEVGIISGGRLVANGSLSVLRNQMKAGRVIRINVLADAEHIIALLNDYPGVTDLTRLNGEHMQGDTWLELYLSGDTTSAAELLTHLIQNDASIAEFRQTGNELEELFLQLTAVEA